MPILSLFRRLFRFASFAAVVAGLSAMSCPAAAQLTPQAPIGSRLKAKPTTFDGDRTHAIVQEFADCVVQRQRELAKAYVLDRSTLGFDKRFRGLADGRCLVEASGTYFDEIGLRLPGQTLRFAFSDALLKSEIAAIDAATFSGAAPLTLPVLNRRDYEPPSGRTFRKSDLEKLDESRNRDQATLVLFRFGECVARAGPAETRAFLLSTPGSANETGAVQALSPVLGNCVEKGTEIKFNKIILRGALAFSYYSLAHAPKLSAEVK